MPNLLDAQVDIDTRFWWFSICPLEMKLHRLRKSVSTGASKVISFLFRETLLFSDLFDQPWVDRLKCRVMRTTLRSPLKNENDGDVTRSIRDEKAPPSRRTRSFKKTLFRNELNGAHLWHWRTNIRCAAQGMAYSLITSFVRYASVVIRFEPPASDRVRNHTLIIHATQVSTHTDRVKLFGWLEMTLKRRSTLRPYRKYRSHTSHTPLQKKNGVADTVAFTKPKIVSSPRVWFLVRSEGWRFRCLWSPTKRWCTVVA